MLATTACLLALATADVDALSLAKTPWRRPHN